MSVFNSLQLAQDACGFWFNGNQPNFISGFSFDSRQLKEGDIFLALKGEKNNGHDYLYIAMEKGAAGAIVEEVNVHISLPQLEVTNVLEAFQRLAQIHRERFLGPVICITGSCGKTTTKDLLTHLIQDDVHSTYLNHNNLLGVPLTLVGLDNFLHKYAVIEAGMNIPGEMACLASMIKPDISIITNVFPVHLEGLGSIENIAHEKAFLANATKEKGIVLFPSACLNYKAFQSLALKAKVLARQEEIINNIPQNQIIRYEVKDNLDHTLSLYIQLNEISGIQIFNLPLLSEGMMTNIALAISLALLIGIKEEEIKNRLLTWKPSKLRGQVYECDKQIYYADCYNANPASMLDALSIFQKRFNFSSRHLYILGCMAELSDQAELYHYKIGKALKLRPEDKVILLGLHATSYALGLIEAGNHNSQIICLQNKEKVFDYLNEFEGTIFLKGSKSYALWELLPGKAKLEEARKVITC